MEVSNEDLQYLPYYDHNAGRVLIKGVPANTKLFVREFRESEFGTKLVEAGLAYVENLDLILEAAQAQFGHEDINMTEYVAVARNMYKIGDLQPKAKPVEQAPVPKALSSSQLAWQEYRVFTDSNPVAACKARARTDEGYRKFLHTNLEREMNDTPVPDAVVAIGTQAVRQDKTVKITQALNDFAISYRTMSTSEVRKNRNLATNPNAADFNRSLDLAISAGLL